MTMNETVSGQNAVRRADRKEARPNIMGVFSLREMGVFYALIILVIVLALITAYLGRTNYLSIQNISNVLYQASLTSIIAVAMTVILISGNFDLSVASVAALSAAVLIGTADSIGFFPAVIVALTVAGLIGLINGAIVEFVGINAFIVTLGSMTAVRGLMLVYTDGRSIFARSDEVKSAMKAFESGFVQVGVALAFIGGALVVFGGIKFVTGRKDGQGISPVPVALVVGGLILFVIASTNDFQIKLARPIIYMVSFTTIVWLVMNYTNVGRRLYAVGGNPEAARLSGINVTRYKLLAFVFCSVTAGFAGILFASRLRSISSTALQGTELTVIAAAILGGTSLFGGVGSVVKSVTGALVLFTLTNGFNIMNLGANYQGLIEGVVVIAAAAIYTIGKKRV